MTLRSSRWLAGAVGLALLLVSGCPGDPGTSDKCSACDTNATCDSTATPPTCVCNAGYTGDGKSCKALTCPALTVEHGSVTPAGEASLNTTATYSCEQGYKLQGEATRKCGSDGAWSGTAPTCVPVVDGCKDSPCAHGACTASDDSGGYTCACETGWTGANCDAPVPCPDLADPANGSVTPKSGTSGTSAAYSCQAGYLLVGEASRTCGSDGAWSGEAPTCAAVPCSPDLAAPAHGKVSAAAGATGDVVTYSCDTGYTLAGNTTRLCQTDGTWSGADPTCNEDADACSAKPCAHGTCSLDGATGFKCACEAGWTGATCADAVTCSGAAAPAHGSVSAATASVGGAVTYSCDQGYALSGPATRTCQADGAFSGSAPACDAKACSPDLAAPADGTVSQTHGLTGDVATYACDTGYALAGSATRQCQADGSWTGAAPTCVSTTTGCSSNPCQHGGQCTESGSGGFTCTCTAGWTGATCSEVVKCSGASAPAHGSVSAATADYNTSVTYSCDQGYTLSGAASRTCQADGTFAGTAPTCAANACAPALAAPTNGTISATSGVTGDVVTYSCDGGFAMNGTATRTCQADGTWSGAAPTCTLIQTGCSPNPCQNAGTCTPSGASGFSCACTTGWTGSTCTTPVTCTGATAPAHGTVSAATATYGTSVTYACDAGYSLSGGASRACQADGTFAGSAPTCAANACAPALAAPSHGSVTATSGVTGDVVTYSCDSSYVLSGNATRTCLTDGTWSGSAPTCTPVSCGAPPVVANAGAPAVSGGLGGGTSNTVGATAAYACDPGYAHHGADPTCGVNGAWSAAPTCDVIDCGAAPTVANAGAPSISGGLGGGATTTYSATAAYTCNTGYTKSGGNPTCGTGGWSAAPTCAPVDCGAAPTVTNAGAPTISGGAGGGATPTYLAVAAYTCNANYAKTGPDATCQASGGWSAAPTCNPVNCGAPPVVANAGAPAVTGGLGGGATTTVGATAAYTCNVGFTVKSGADPVCRATGLWDAAPTCNPVDCGTPPVVANAGAPVVSGGAGGGSTPTYQAVAAYTCNANFNKSGSDPICQVTGAWSGAPTCTLCGSYTDVVYRLVGGFRIGDTALGMGNQSFSNLGANASTPPFAGSGNTTPFAIPGPVTTFSAGFARLRFTNDTSGNPKAGTVSLVEFYFPLEFRQTKGATIDINTDHSYGLLASGTANCGAGDAACTNQKPTLARPCASGAQGNVSGSTLTWGSCTPVPTGKTSWSYTSSARSAAGAGCASGWNAWGNASCTSGCSLVPACSKGDSYQTWNQFLQTLTFSSSTYKSAKFTMPEIQVPNCSGASTTWLSITDASVVTTQCGSTPGTDLVCNVQ